jgi:hypothetical protein
MKKAQLYIVSALLIGLGACAVGAVRGQSGSEESERQAQGEVLNPDTTTPEDPTVYGPPDDPVTVEPEVTQNVVPTTPPNKPLTIRFFVLQGEGQRAYEVRRGARTGGRFIRTRTRGAVHGVPIVGYTDRASTGESILIHIGGGGTAGKVGIRIGRDMGFSWDNVNLPVVLKRQVRTVSGKSICSFVEQEGKSRIVKRLPFGPR